MIEFDYLIIKQYISKVNFDTNDIQLDILLATILSYILDIEFSDIDRTKSFIKFNNVGSQGFDIQVISRSKKPNLIFSGYPKCSISIRIGLSEGEYLDAQEIKDWEDLHTLRQTLNNLFKNPLTEELIYCKNKLVGSNCFISYSLYNIDDIYKFSKRLGSCLPWNKRVETIIYEPWIKS